MSSPRFVDTLPTPEKAREKKVILLSYSRSGTHGLHNALNGLGFRTYHMSEVVKKGLTDIKCFHEALAEKLKGPAGRPYSRDDLEKWLHDYDALAIIPCYLTEEVLAAYPDAKFILTERDSRSWARSIWNTIANLHVATQSFPLVALKRFDEAKLEWCDLVNKIFNVISGGKGRTDAGFENAVQHYEQYNERIKKMIPADKLLVIRLEDGLGWEQICPFLEVDTPAIPYPRGNDPNEFKKLVGGFLGKGNAKAFAVMGTTVAAFGLGLWYTIRGRR